MELIAGEPNYIVEHVRLWSLSFLRHLTRAPLQHESNCSFTFDFTQVYWNSRLHTEHERLVQLFKPNDVIADVFAGVGPFAIPAAKKGCAVFANDLNPNSYKYLSVNIDQNRVEDLVRPSCEDGRDFIRTVARRAAAEPFAAYTGPRLTRTQQRAQRRAREDGDHAPGAIQSAGHSGQSEGQPAPRRTVNHFVMNLPDSAITFLDSFRGILSASREGSLADDDVGVARDLSGVYDDLLPMVHCHCFTRELQFADAEKDIRQVRSLAVYSSFPGKIILMTLLPAR
jgi:tRNA (guanine37-N1)-methyltransferase